MPPQSNRKDYLDDTAPEDLIISTDLEDEERFEAISLELANKNARKILREVIKGFNTSTLIAEKTGLTVQDVINHLNRLEDIGLVESDGIDTSSFRGRSAKRYRVSKVAVLLIPSQPEDEPRLREQLKRKSVSIIRKRFFLSIFASLAWGLVFLSAAVQSEVQHFRSGVPPPNSNTTSIPLSTFEIISRFSPETWLLVISLTIASSIAVFLLSRLFLQKIIR